MHAGLSLKIISKHVCIKADTNIALEQETIMNGMRKCTFDAGGRISISQFILVYVHVIFYREYSASFVPHIYIHTCRPVCIKISKVYYRSQPSTSYAYGNNAP